jgi:hypothetical protein
MDTCKICGASRDPLKTDCKFCGTSYQLSNITGETYINALSAILRSAESSDARVSAISTFAMPLDLDGMLQFLAFCHGNAQMVTTDAAGEEIQGAWYGKAKMAFAQIKIKSISNPSLAPLVAEYEPLYGVNARKPMQGSTKVLIGGFCALMAFGSFMAYLEESEKSLETQRLQAISGKVQDAIARRNWDEAETLANQIQWTAKDTGILFAKEGAPFIKMREGYLKQIQNAKNQTRLR